MKNKTLVKTLAVIVTVLTFTVNCFAGNTVSIQMTCTIPEIPGVNAPPYKDGNEPIKNEIVAEKQDNYTEEDSKTESQELIQQESNTQVQLADGKTQDVNLQTVYSR